MGNLASVAKALERAGADVRVTRTPRRCEAADGVVLPGVGRFPRRRRRLDAERPGRRRDARASRPACPSSASASACSCSSRAAPRAAAARSRRPRADVRAARPRLKVPHIGWNQLEGGRRAGHVRGIPAARRLLLRPLVRGACRPPGRRRGRRPTTAATSARLWRGTTSGRSSSIRRRARHGLGLLATSSRW